MAGIKRFGRAEGIVSLVVPATFYLTLSTLIFLSIWPYFYYVKNETLLVLGAFALWRYGWLLINYTRAAIYSLHRYPKLKKLSELKSSPETLPEHIFFIIPSYDEEPWVSVEMMNAVLSNMADIPSNGTLIVSTKGDADDKTIVAAFRSHPAHTKVDLVLQHQKDGKRIALGHALRAVARRYKDEPNSVTILMDGDSYLEPNTLAKSLPFFTTFKDLGALTTNEVAYVHTKSQWYKDWFNLKFGQRHMLFQSHALSNKVLTLTGRFSMFRTSIIVSEDFINMIENDTITHWLHGKFRFLMGDDKSSWFYLLKNKWSMLYLPDIKVYSLESRDANFWELSTSLPFRWHGNTLRNNSRALALGPDTTGWFIWFAILDQRLTMWTSLVGLVGASLLTIYKSFIYLPFYFAWVFLVRTIQTAVIAFMGHPVSILTVPLMLYNQWVGSFIKIKAFYHLSTQKWSKGANTQQSDIYHAINNKAVWVLAKFRYFGSFLVFGTAITAAHGFVSLPPVWHFFDKTTSSFESNSIVPNDGLDDSEELQRLIDNSAMNSKPIFLPPGVLNIDKPIEIERDDIQIIGSKSGTKIVSSFESENRAVFEVKGNRSNKSVVAQTVDNNSHALKVMSSHQFDAGFTVLVLAENSEDFLDQIGSTSWRKQYPQVRRLISRVKSIENGFLELEHPLEPWMHISPLKVYTIESVKNFSLENLTIEYQIANESIDDYRHMYVNQFPQNRTDLVRLEWTENAKLNNVNLLSSGSHPISIENSLECDIHNIQIRDAWNKGKSGSGYLRISKSHYCNFNMMIVNDIRHVTIQWGSSHNTIRNLYTNVDVNFHGGYSNNNYVEGISDVKPQHKWPPVYRTPNDAHWASPDGPSNVAEMTILATPN